MVKIHIVDAPCGFGKTSGAINMMNSNDDTRYMFITPFLKEVERIKTNCKKRRFYEPQEIQTKLNGIHWLLSNKKDIASTHALFLYFNDYTTELIKQGEYTLVLDEVADVVEPLNYSKKDIETILEKYAHIEDGLLIWDDMDYTGKFSDIKNWSLNKCVGIYQNNAILWCFPIEIFKAFKEVYILTYMFDAQIQRYYYDFYDMKYDYIYIEYKNDRYTFTDKKKIYDLSSIKKKIKIVENENLNLIGETETALSVSWFTRDRLETSQLIKELKNNLGNYYKHILKSPSDSNMWTTFKEFKKILQGGGYTRGFVSITARATNEYRHKSNLAYCANRYMNPILKQFFALKDVHVDEEKYALSELIQWTWRSSIRDGKKITIYIPSSRMRTILYNWLEE